LTGATFHKLITLTNVDNEITILIMIVIEELQPRGLIIIWQGWKRYLYGPLKLTTGH